MKLKTNDPNSNSLGIEEAKEFSIDTSNQMIVSILRDKLYSNKIGAVCREVASNSRDANREAGRGDIPITISIYTEDSITDEVQTFISFQDSGVGISPERIENVFLKYGSSTKRNSNTQTGGFGIGAKTPFAYNNEFLIETVSEDDKGKRLKCIYQAIIMNETGIETSNLITISKEKTTENTGTKIIIPIKEKDIYDFEKEVVKATMFWSARPVYNGFKNFTNVNVKIEVANNNWKVIKGDYKSFLGVRSYEMFLLVDEIPYIFDYIKVNSNDFTGITESFIIAVNGSSWESELINMVISFNTGDLSLSASREEIEYTEGNLLKIQDEIKKVEVDLIKKVKQIIEEEETLIEKTFFLNSFKSSESADVLGKYLKRIELFEKIKGEYNISYTTNDILRKHLKTPVHSVNNKLELYEYKKNTSVIRVSKKAKRETSITLKREELEDSIIVFKSSEFRVDSQINRTLTNINKKVFVFIYDSFFINFDKDAFRNELSELLRPINVDVLEYSEIEKTKAPKRTYEYNGERVKQDKNIRTIYFREFGKGGIYKNSKKYNVSEKQLSENYDKLIILPLLDDNNLKELDRRVIEIRNYIKGFELEYLKDVNYNDVLSFVIHLGYKIFIVGSNHEYDKIKNTPHTTVEKVFEDLLKDKNVIDEFKKQIDEEYINGAGMVKVDSEEYSNLTSQVYETALSLVGFNINNYKIFKKENNTEEQEEITTEIAIVKNYHTFKSVKNAIKTHIKTQIINDNKFVGYLSQKIVEEFKEKLKEKYPIFHYTLQEINSYYGRCIDYDIKDKNLNTIKTGKELWKEQLLHMLKLEIKNKSKEGELIVNATTERRGRPKGLKNKIKII
jgi:uncharacterized membrane-anchored protein YhcB (DUF1043 family)